MTRIIGGSAGGRRIKTPVGAGTRPTSDRVREALFSALEHEIGTLDGCRVLDLYAGSGAVGLEALSRGAVRATLVEADRGVAAVIRGNAAALDLGGVEVVTAHAEHWAEHRAGHRAASPGEAFDVVFVDPPYAVSGSQLRAVLASLLAAGRLTADAIVVVERASRDTAWDWPIGLVGLRAKRYGETMLWYGHPG